MKLRIAVSALALSLAALPASADSADPIKLTLHDWSGQLITTTLMGEVLKAGGHNVDYVQADYIAQFAGLETGDLHVAMEIWETTGREAMDASFATGKVVSMGETGLMAIEEWWYPAYMEERCPGLPDWEALKDCAEVFSTPETAPLGRYLGGPVTWGGFDEERVEALELDFEVVHAGTDAALFAELEAAYQREDPIVLWVYSPHWAPAKYDGTFVEFPPYSAECYADPSVGVNPDAAYDCGKPTGPIWKVAHAGLAESHPDASEIIKKFTMNNDDYGALVAEVDLNGKSVDDTVAAWMDANKDTWMAWLN